MPVLAAMPVRAAISTERAAMLDTYSDFIVDILSAMSKKTSLENCQPAKRIVEQFGNARTTNAKFGTPRWSWEIDQGCKICIPLTSKSSPHTAKGNVQVLDPQHWAETQNSKN
jgi:hypothetical protein